MKKKKEGLGSEKPKNEGLNAKGVLKKNCKFARGEIEDVKERIIQVKNLWLNANLLAPRDEDYKGQSNEIMVNLMLAYRHLEDARMRMGKAMQAATKNGKSIYDV